MSSPTSSLRTGDTLCPRPRGTCTSLAPMPQILAITRAWPRATWTSPPRVSSANSLNSTWQLEVRRVCGGGWWQRNSKQYPGQAQKVWEGAERHISAPPRTPCVRRYTPLRTHHQGPLPCRDLRTAGPAGHPGVLCLWEVSGEGWQGLVGSLGKSREA